MDDPKKHADDGPVPGEEVRPPKVTARMISMEVVDALINSPNRYVRKLTWSGDRWGEEGCTEITITCVDDSRHLISIVGD